MEVDDSRHILYTLSEKGTITVYDLDADGKNTSRVVAVPHNNIMNAALQVAKWDFFLLVLILDLYIIDVNYVCQIVYICILSDLCL